MIESNETILSTIGVHRLTGRSNDVIHSMYIPRLRFKIDLVPGRLTTSTLEISNFIYYGVCAEICGANHAFIPFKICI